MGQPILPQVIASPAIVTWNGKAYYTKSGIRSQLRRETFFVETDTVGKIDERHKSAVTEVSFQPDGQMLGAGLAGFFPWSAAQVGGSLFTGLTGAVLPLVIQTKFGGTNNAGTTITFPRAAITKMPTMRLKPTDTLFGDMTVTCIGDPTVQPSTAGSWATLASAAFGDTSFDDTSIITDFYSASWGGGAYASMGSMNGFEVELGMETENIMADDFGIADTILKSLTASCKFAPSNMTEANVQALMGMQGSGVVYPGQSLTKANNDLIIAGSGNAAHTLTVTIYKAGPKNAGFQYSSGKHRFDVVDWTSRRTWTAGVANPLWNISLT